MDLDSGQTGLLEERFPAVTCLRLFTFELFETLLRQLRSTRLPTQIVDADDRPRTGDSLHLA